MAQMNNGAQSEAQFRVISLRDLVAPLFRRKSSFLTTFLILLALSTLVGALLPPSFRSQMAILVNRERVDPLVTTEATSQMPPNTNNDVSVDEITSEAELLRSQDILRDVVIATGLDKQRSNFTWPFRNKGEEENRERAVINLAKALKVENKTNSHLIQVSYSSSDPKKACAVLQALAMLYLKKHLEVHRPPGSFQFFADETTKYRNALHESEEALRDFSQKAGAAAPDIERSNLAEQVTNLIGQLEITRQAVASDENRIRTDQSQLNETPQRSATVQAVAPADKLLGDLGIALLAAQTKRAQLALKFDPNYPLVQQADREVSLAQSAIAEAQETKYISQSTDRDPTFELLREDLAKTQADLAGQQAGVTALQRGIQTLQAQMVDLDHKALTQQDLLRDAKANEDSYLLYLSKREQERTSDALDQTRIGNVAIAVPPAIPALPTYSLWRVLCVASLISFFLSILTAYVIDYFDPSFNTPAEVVDTLGIPVVITMSKKTA